ncbi:MAG: S6e family ribosomal protein [archaeon]|nr:S6e family ribosomal protein [archaeon]
MVFKINTAHKGRTWKCEIDNEELIRTKIGDKINGNLISQELEGYELEITGTSDISGFPGIKGEIGGQLRKRLLTKNQTGMRNSRHDGLRLRKTVRGEEVSEKTSQINLKVLKEGSKKWDELCPAKPAKEKNDDKSKAPKVEEKKE